MSCFNRGGCGCNNDNNWWNDCNNNGENDRCERERREAYWAGFRDGCRKAPCRWRNDFDDDCD